MEPNVTLQGGKTEGLGHLPYMCSTQEDAPGAPLDVVRQLKIKKE